MSDFVRIPAPVDPHTHLRDLDWHHKATFSSETRAAVAGGYWAVFDMPNTPPETTSRLALDTKLSRLAAAAVCDYGVYAGASQADNTAEYTAMAQETCGLKIFNNSTTGDLLLDNQADRAHHMASWPSGRIIAVHAENETVRDILALVRKHRKPTHFLHISTAQEIADLRAAKAEGLPITVGVCPHHLYLTDDDLTTLGGYGMMKPPLKTAQDVMALWQALRDGTVDIVESDHAPHTRAEKETTQPAYGVPGLETTIPLLLTAVHDGRLTFERVVELVSLNVHRIWGLTPPEDTYTVVDLDAAYTIDSDTLYTHCQWTPFDGFQARGRVVETWIRGTRVYDGENVLVEPGSGQHLFGGAS